MNLRQLDAFRAIVLSGSTLAAARRIGVSQPAISRLIADLEHTVGFPLFERRNRRLLLRPEGRDLYTEVEMSYVGLEKIAQRAQQIRAQSGGQLRIACAPAASLGLLPEAIRRFLERRPDAAISVEIGPSHRVAELAATRQFDFGIAAFPLSGRGIILHQVVSLPCVFVAPPGHPAQRRTHVTPEMLAGQNFISQERDSDLRRDVDAIFDSRGIERRLVVEATTSAHAIHLVRLGVGISIVDPLTAAAMQEGVVQRPFQPHIDYAYAILLSDDAVLSQAAKELLEILTQEAQRLQASKRVALP
ncbi:LysR substrate-binding domain-containing protein [Roseomonas gilardii]|uniref:LysR substrate-binding domain-containing protein n=1 Tax=Roseomonas gilardii TaxID=257708 RepID=UPI001643F650|nr:LysR substrate-binding domain-containing protein [Roseomonas gilardii]